MQNWAATSVIVNIMLALVLIVLVLAWPGVHFGAPWDGPAVATVGLAAATVVLGGVGVWVGLLAFWGYTSLRGHAADIAKEVATEVANRAVEQKFETLLRQWGREPPGSDGEEVARAYERE